MHYSTFWKMARQGEGPVCFWCGGAICHHTASRDHLIPRAQHGTDVAFNVVLSCLDCNCDRGKITHLFCLLTKRKYLDREYMVRKRKPILPILHRFRERINTQLRGKCHKICLNEIDFVLHWPNKKKKK